MSGGWGAVIGVVGNDRQCHKQRSSVSLYSPREDEGPAGLGELQALPRHRRRLCLCRDVFAR